MSDKEEGTTQASDDAQPDNINVEVEQPNVEETDHDKPLDLSLDDESEAKDTEATTEDEKPSEESQEQKEESTEDTKEESKDESEGEADEPKETETNEQKDKAREAYQRRQQRANVRREVETQLNKHYGPPTKEQLMESRGLSDREASLEEKIQNLDYKQESQRIVNLNENLTVEATDVLKDYPVFDPGTPDKPNQAYDPNFTKEVQTLYEKAANLTRDDNGIIVNANESLYDFYSRMANIRGSGVSRGESKGKQEAVRMLSRSEKPSTGTPPAKSADDDPFLKGFNRTT